MAHPSRLTSAPHVGRWRIVEMDLLAQENVDLVAPGFIELERARTSGLGFIAGHGDLDRRGAPRDGHRGVAFSCEGIDECDPATGRGWALIEEDGSLRGRAFFRLGDDSGFRAERWKREP